MLRRLPMQATGQTRETLGAYGVADLIRSRSATGVAGVHADATCGVCINPPVPAGTEIVVGGRGEVGRSRDHTQETHRRLAAVGSRHRILVPVVVGSAGKRSPPG